MKKLFAVLTVLLMSVVAFADGTSCSIRGLSGETISIIWENKQSGSNGQVCTTVKNSSTRDVRVIVKCYDAYTDECVGVKSVLVKAYSADVCFDVKKDHPYYFRVSDAHCG